VSDIHIDDMYYPTYIINMKPVQVLFHEDLLAELDTDAEVRLRGRSSVLRELAVDYLKKRRQSQLNSQYEAGYGGCTEVHDELAGWDEEGEWPDR